MSMSFSFRWIWALRLYLHHRPSSSRRAAATATAGSRHPPHPRPITTTISSLRTSSGRTDQKLEFPAVFHYEKELPVPRLDVYTIFFWFSEKGLGIGCLSGLPNFVLMDLQLGQFCGSGIRCLFDP
jgi:hypothetical protein